MTQPQPQLQINGDLTGQAAIGDTVIQLRDVSGGQVTINVDTSALVAASLHQLPPPPADFTGRVDELAQLTAAIEQGGATISGLRGMGGIGKTALALQLAAQLTPRYPDAQFYLDLKGASPNPLTPAQAMAHIVRAYHPTARLPVSIFAHHGASGFRPRWATRSDDDGEIPGAKKVTIVDF